MKYFYTDLLAAAWMAKHFGMRYDEGETEIRHDEGQSGMGDSPSHIRIYSGRWSIPGKFHIHTDLLHLLEPRQGDLVEEAGEFHMWKHLAHVKKTFMFDKIIQRNGIPFMWPESEQ